MTKVKEFVQWVLLPLTAIFAGAVYLYQKYRETIELARRQKNDDQLQKDMAAVLRAAERSSQARAGWAEYARSVRKRAAGVREEVRERDGGDGGGDQ